MLTRLSVALQRGNALMVREWRQKCLKGAIAGMEAKAAAALGKAKRGAYAGRKRQEKKKKNGAPAAPAAPAAEAAGAVGVQA